MPALTPAPLNTCHIIDSTLREGEQCRFAAFSTQQKIHIAQLLDRFGVSYIEHTSPLASPRSFQDCQTLAQLGLRAKILTHIRCHMDDARRAVATGVQGINLVIGTSSYLRQYGHGKSISQIIEAAKQVIGFLQQFPVEIRFSTEDSLRSDPEDLFRIYRAVDALGVARVGVADTVGIGTPDGIAALVAELRSQVRADIEFHGHNDTGCAIANAFAALQAGATHINTTVLGIGERNGITALGGFIARLYATHPELVSHYDLPTLVTLDETLARELGLHIPFNNYITGSCAFSHKAGIHTKAVLQNPRTYEALTPEDFGLRRHLQIAHQLTGWNAIRHRSEALGLSLTPAELRTVTQELKALADAGPVNAAQLDQLLFAQANSPAAGIPAATHAYSVEEVSHVSNAR